MTEDTSLAPSETPRQFTTSAREQASVGLWLASKLQPGEGSRLVRWLLLYGGVIAPALFLLSGVGGLPDFMRSYRAPTLHRHAAVMFRPSALFPFAPFLLHSAAACSVALLDMDRYGRRRWVRWGLYTGVILAVQYLIVQGLVMQRVETWLSREVLLVIPLMLIVCVSVPVVVFGLGWVCWRKLQRRSIKLTLDSLVPYMLVMTVVGFFVFAMAGPGWMLFFGFLLLAPLWPVAALIAAIPIAAPSWAVGTFLLLSICAGRWYGGKQLRLWQFFLAFVWFGFYFTAWRFAFAWATS